MMALATARVALAALGARISLSRPHAARAPLVLRAAPPSPPRPGAAAVRQRAPALQLTARCAAPRRLVAARAGGGSYSATNQQLWKDTPGEKEEEAPKEQKPRPPAPQVTKELVSVSFARSGGKGGQNVNKVNTKADMRFNLLEADWIDDKVKDVLLETQANKINAEGELVVSSTKHRTQSGNVDDALKKMQAMLEEANIAAYPREATADKKKKIKALAKKANQRRLNNKKKHSDKKKLRRDKNKGDW